MKKALINLPGAIRFNKRMVYNVVNFRRLLTFLDNNMSDLPRFHLETSGKKEDSGQMGIMVV